MAALWVLLGDGTIVLLAIVLICLCLWGKSPRKE